MKDTLLFKKYATSKLLPILYWIGFLGIFLAVPRVMQIYDDIFGYGGDPYHVESLEKRLHFVEMEKENMLEYQSDDYYGTEYMDEEIAMIKRELEDEKSFLEEDSGDILPMIIIFLVLQIVWRVFCEWWFRWFNYINVERSSERNQKSESNLIKDFGMFKSNISPGFYLILYYILALGLLGILLYTFGFVPGMGITVILEVILYFVILEMILRLYFEMMIALFKYLKRS